MKKEGIFIVYKRLGETPLEALERLRQRRGLGGTKMTYAGRLDPLAEGALLILAGEKCKEKENYLKLKKTYEFEVLFGFETDSLDLLGLVTEKSLATLLPFVPEIKKAVRELKGSHILPYPAYSSKTVRGLPLWLLERGGKLTGKDIPKRKMTVQNIKFLAIREITSAALFRQITARIKKVRGDFRQEKILKKWEAVLRSPQKANKKNKERFLIAKFEMKCGGGTYVRSIVKKIGEVLKLPAVVFSIRRTELNGV